jgi:hypothetical protein
MDAFEYAALQNAIVRLVVPIRREFGVAIDVPRMRHNIDYAEFAVSLARNSDSPLLQERAEFIEGYIRAVRQRAAVAAAAVPVGAQSAAVVA